MLVKRIAARSMYTSIFNRLHAIARYWSEIATFSYPLALNAPVRSSPWDNRGICYGSKENSMFVKRIAACAPSTVSQ